MSLSHLKSGSSRCRVVVDHAIDNDLRCLKIRKGEHLDPAVIRDTQIHYKERYFYSVNN